MDLSSVPVKVAIISMVTVIILVGIAFLPRLKISNERKQWWLAFCWMVSLLLYWISAFTTGTLAAMFYKGFAALLNKEMGDLALSRYVGVFSFAWLLYAISVSVEFFKKD